MTTETSLATQEGAIAPALPASLDIGAMLTTAMRAGITPENATTLERMMAMYERMEERDAEKQFARAFAALQAEMPSIKAVKEVPDKNGNLKYRFAPYEDIMEQVRPLMLKHGFTVTFSATFNEGRVTQSCTLQHTGGHKQTNQFAARIGSGPPGCSEAQGDGAAATYAKRHALCYALNIVIERDEDGADPKTRAAVIGAPIDPAQVQTLNEMVKDCQAPGGPGLDLPKFLQYAGAKSIAEIGTGDYSKAFAALQKKLGRN